MIAITTTLYCDYGDYREHIAVGDYDKSGHITRSTSILSMTGRFSNRRMAKKND